MARKLKPFKVDRVVNAKTRVSVDIFLDRNKQTFFGMIGPTKIEAATAKECKALVLAALRDYSGLIWKPFLWIEVESKDRSHHHRIHNYAGGQCRVAVRFARFMGAKAVDGKWVEKPFDEDVHTHSPFKDEYLMKFWARGDNLPDGVIAYSEEAWASLQDIERRMNELGRQLLRVIDGEFLMLRGRDLISKVLPAPSKSSRKSKSKTKGPRR